MVRTIQRVAGFPRAFRFQLRRAVHKLFDNDRAKGGVILDGLNKIIDVINVSETPERKVDHVDRVMVLVAAR
jgi:hypothetical protein